MPPKRVFTFTQERCRRPIADARKIRIREALGRRAWKDPDTREAGKIKKEPWHKSQKESQRREEELVTLTTEARKSFERGVKRKEQLIRWYETWVRSYETWAKRRERTCIAEEEARRTEDVPSRRVFQRFRVVHEQERFVVGDRHVSGLKDVTRPQEQLYEGSKFGKGLDQFDVRTGKRYMDKWQKAQRTSAEVVKRRKEKLWYWMETSWRRMKVGWRLQHLIAMGPWKKSRGSLTVKSRKDLVSRRRWKKKRKVVNKSERVRPKQKDRRSIIRPDLRKSVEKYITHLMSSLHSIFISSSFVVFLILEIFLVLFLRNFCCNPYPLFLFAHFVWQWLPRSGDEPPFKTETNLS